MKEFMHDHFDKLILVFLILVFGVPVIFNRGEVQFAQRLVDSLSGALTALIVQRLSAKPPTQNP